MRALVTGANGFLGKNLQIHLLEKGIETVSFTREMLGEQLLECLTGVDFVFHLAAQALVKPSYEFPLETLTSK